MDDSKQKNDVAIEIIDDDTAVNSTASEAYGARIRKTLALVGLVVVQVSVGVATKLSVSGKETINFNPASLLIVTESIKFCMSWASHASSLWRGSLPKALFAALTEAFSSLKALAFPYSILAFMYAVNNNLSWMTFRQADLTSMSTVRSGSILISAVLSTIFLKQRITPVQWAAMVGQTAAVYVSQADACGGHLRLNTATYLMMFVMILLSCFCAVWNEKLVKGVSAPLSMQQMTMYGFGFLFNSMFYFFSGASEENVNGGFFVGWKSWTFLSAFFNSFMGLAVIATLKYGDSIVKAMATPITTICVSFVDIRFLGNVMSTTAIVATIPIFTGSFIYIQQSAGVK